MGRLLDGSLRRLVPAGWTSPGRPRHSADGSVLGVCGYRMGGDPYPAVTEVASWVIAGSGERLATLPGCLYDVAADRGAAVVVATHDPEVVELCDRVVRLVDGHPVDLPSGELDGPVA